MIVHHEMPGRKHFSLLRVDFDSLLVVYSRNRLARSLRGHRVFQLSTNDDPVVKSLGAEDLLYTVHSSLAPVNHGTPAVKREQHRLESTGFALTFRCDKTA